MDTEVVERHKPFRISPITRQIQEYLKKAEEGELVTYQDLKELTGFNCSSSGPMYDNLCSARNRLALWGCHFAVIPGKGMRRLHPNEAVEYWGHKMKLVRKTGVRKIRELGSVDTKRLGKIEALEYKAVVFTGKAMARLLSSRVKSKLIEDIKKHPMKELDYDRLSDVYTRGRACVT